MTDIDALAKFWPLIYATVREFWAVTEPHIEDAAVRIDIPIELYYYSELGLEYFSLEEFQKRDPFTNPEQFEKAFARFDVKGWIIPLPDERYQVSRKAREGVRRIVRAGDDQLTGFDLLADSELKQLEYFLQQIVVACIEAPEPPQKWAVLTRFRVAEDDSPPIVQIREFLLDLFAYRDDSHLSAARPHFGRAGIVWDVLGAIWNGSAVNAGQMAERMSIRGYEESEYAVAIQAAVEIGWVEAADLPDTFRPTTIGREVREGAERLTDEFFYRPWSVLTDAQLEELYALLAKLQGQLAIYKKRLASNNHL